MAAEVDELVPRSFVLRALGGICRQTLNKRVEAREFPPPAAQRNGAESLWFRSDVEKHLAQLAHNRAAMAAAAAAEREACLGRA